MAATEDQKLALQLYELLSRVVTVLIAFRVASQVADITFLPAQKLV